jgi:bacterioferritin-associated ferredoxin
MFVCICANVTDRQIKQAAGEGASSLDDLAVQLGVGTGCGCCREMAQQVLEAALDAPVDAAAVASMAPVLHAREIARVAAPARGV